MGVVGSPLVMNRVGVFRFTCDCRDEDGVTDWLSRACPAKPDDTLLDATSGVTIKPEGEVIAAAGLSNNADFWPSSIAPAISTVFKEAGTNTEPGTDVGVR